jgi:hypothetical protein
MLLLQAMKLGLFPTMTVKHTGGGHAGQIYIAEVNYLLMFACVLVVAGFQDTTALGTAYGTPLCPGIKFAHCASVHSPPPPIPPILLMFASYAHTFGVHAHLGKNTSQLN